MAMSIDEAFERLAKLEEQGKENRKMRQVQRRNTVTDAKTDFQTMLRGKGRIYTGYEISRDMQFIMRYSFNLHIRPFVTTIAQTLTTADTSLSVVKKSDTSDQHEVQPNPHNHEVNLGIEINEHNFDTSSLRLKINGVDITDAIIEEYGSFVDGYGYFPANDENYDMLLVAEHLANWEKAVVLGAGRKEIEITQDENTLCECEISYYIKYNHIDRGGLS